MFSNDRQSQSSEPAWVEILRPGVAFVLIICGALLAFELFNYSTTEVALSDLLGDLTFAGLRWATLLSLAFCGIDFAGIARLFTPAHDPQEPKEAWYLFAAWMLAATMNAILTWWGVSMAIATHTLQSSLIVDARTISTAIPVFVAILVWVIRILIIGTLSMAIDRLVRASAASRQGKPGAALGAKPAPRSEPTATRAPSSYAPRNQASQGLSAAPKVTAAQGIQGAARTASPAGRPSAVRSAAPAQPNPAPRAEPTYHNLSGKPKNY